MDNLLIGIVASLLFNVCFGLRAFSPNNWGYAVSLARKGLTVTNITQLRYKLKACSNGHIFLQEHKMADVRSNDSWAFMIGSFANTQSEIRQSPLHKTRYGEHKEVLLHCDQFRPFWIRWKGGLLELGKGSEIGTNRISFHTITPVGFNYGFLLTGWGSTGCWDIETPLDIVLTSGWKKVPGNRKLYGQTVKGYHAESVPECADRCATTTEVLPCGCVVYSYNKLTKQCLVVDESETSTIVTATGWTTWQLM